MKYSRDVFWLHVGCWFCRWLWSPGFQSTAERVGGFTAEIRGGRDRLRKKKRPNDLPRLFCTFLWLLFHLWLKRSHRLSLTDCRRGPAAKKKKRSTLCFFRADKWLWEAVRVLSDGFQIFSVTSVTSAPCWVEVFALAQLFKPGVGLWNLYPEAPFFTSVFKYVVIFVTVNWVIVFLCSVFQWFWMVLTGGKKL